MPNGLSQLPPPPQGQTGMSFNDLKNLPPPPSGQQGMSLAQINQSQTPTTDNPQYQETPATQDATEAFKVAQGLGIAKLGMGLATAGRVASGSINQTGDENAQSLKDTLAVTQQLHKLIQQGVPANDLRRLQLVNFLKRTQGDQNQTQAQIDPGTQLSDREVVGSAVSMAGIVAASGDIPGMNPEVANPSLLSGGERVLQGAEAGIKAGAVVGATQGLGSGLQNNQENAGQVATQTVKSGLTGAAVGGVIGGGVSAAQEGINALKTPANAELNKITDTISPKMTAKETKLALSQGRIVEGQDPTLLRSGTPDTVIPSDKTNQVAQTIQEQIPGASKMSQTKLFDALNKNGLAMRDSLTPIMQQTPLQSNDIKNISDALKTLQTKQLADGYIPTNVNVEKLQSSFQNDIMKPLLEKSNPTMNDAWVATQQYDASVPQSVKSATSMSSDTLQAQKSIWLQNRSILADVTHNVQTGMDATSQKAFSSMSDMYTAKENILSKFKLDKTGGLSKLGNWAANNKAGIAIGGYAANKVAGKLGLPSIPLP